jgi:two-component system, response regulator YesN
MAEDRMSKELIKVLIVDDELLVRQGLRLTVDWKKYDMTVVDDAPNGSLGWQKFLEHKPQVVITDIVMPEMDGIELALKIREKQPDTKILFLSCHQDFSFAQKGMRIGVSDYIVKTSLDDHQMDQSLGKIRSEIIKHHTASEAFQRSASMEDNVPEFGLEEKNQAARAPFKQYMDHQWKRVESGGYIFNMYLNDNNLLQDRKAEIYKELSNTLSLVSGIKILFFNKSEQSLFLVTPLDAFAFYEIELLQFKMKHPFVDWRFAGPVTNSEQSISVVNKLNRLRIIEARLDLRSKTHKEDILQAIDYIDQNLHLDLRAADVASKIGVSRSYFSTIFKEVTGCTIISFISDRKVERAKELLRVTSFRLEEIAEKVGINDAKYFSKWFKKSVALTPGQYRFQTK